MFRAIKPVRAAFRLTEEEHQRWSSYAAQRGVTFSDLCRTALQQIEAQEPDNAQA